MIWSVPFRDQFSILAKSVKKFSSQISLLPQSQLPHTRSQDPSQRFTDFFLFVLAIILMLSRGVIVTAANYHSSPLKAESNGHITVEKRQEPI